MATDQIPPNTAIEAVAKTVTALPSSSGEGTFLIASSVGTEGDPTSYSGLFLPCYPSLTFAYGF